MNKCSIINVHIKFLRILYALRQDIVHVGISMQISYIDRYRWLVDRNSCKWFARYGSPLVSLIIWEFVVHEHARESGIFTCVYQILKPWIERKHRFAGLLSSRSTSALGPTVNSFSIDRFFFWWEFQPNADLTS